MNIQVEGVSPYITEAKRVPAYEPYRGIERAFQRDLEYHFGIEHACLFIIIPSWERFGGHVTLMPTPTTEPFAEDYIRNRRHEFDWILPFALSCGMPTFDWSQVPEPMLPEHHDWYNFLKEMAGETWQVGFGVPLFGPFSRRGYLATNTQHGSQDTISKSYRRAVKESALRHFEELIYVSQECHRKEGRHRLREDFRLTPTEAKVMQYLAMGHDSYSIGHLLRRGKPITQNTVNTHIKRVLNKLGGCSRMEACRLLASHGYIF